MGTPLAVKSHNTNHNADLRSDSPDLLQSTQRRSPTTSTPPKRKRSNASQTSPKKRRVDSDSHTSAGLPTELWQYTFTFLPPETLARIQRVNKHFRLCLTVEPDTSTRKNGRAQPMRPDDIWAAARLLHHPTWPAPLSPLADLEFWTLALGRSCQFCKRPPDRQRAGSDDPWASGPGEEGVCIIWQFGIRSCGSCLRERVQTEVSLLVTDQSAFLQVLPFTFITSTLHVVSPSIIQGGTPIPPHVNLLKYFYKGHVDMAQTLLDQARSEGNTTAYVDELLQIKSTRMESAAEWERVDLARQLRPAQTPPTPSATPLTKTSPTPKSPLAPQALTRRTSSIVGLGSKTPALHHYQNPLSRNGRSMTEANEGKAARRSDIEQRCGALVPPIPPSLLPHMESFQAAIQISNQLTDDAWNLLKPRLESQREAAEQREQDRIASDRASAAGNEERRKQDAAIKGAKEETDRQWEESQEPLRHQLGGYADDYIRDYWANGHSVTVELMPRFAADLLISVRARYFSELAMGDASVFPASADSRRGKLVLDSTRWVYDNKVKPLTEARKELFLCNGCDSLKFYAFDGVIQHYAAKHTEAFSIGHIVVHWQTAEWPEHPPFAPDPDAKRRQAQEALLQAAHPPQLGPFGGYAGGMSPGPYGNPAYGPQYHPMGPFQAPGPYTAADRAQHNFSPSYPAVRGGFHPAAGYMGMPPASPFNGRPAFYGPGPNNSAAGNAAWGPAPYSQPQAFNQVAGPPHSSNLYQTQLEEVAGSAREIWGLVSNVRGLPQSVRLFCVITSVVSRFQRRFSNEPSLDLFTDCLINHKLMRPLKDASPLACKVCVENNDSHEGSDSPSFPLSSGERKLYPFHSLLVHFKNVHIEHAMNGQDERRLDWKTNMIELPSDEYISRLSRVQGIDRIKMQLLVATFPSTSWATEGDPMVHDSDRGTNSATNYSPSGSGFPGPGRSSAASHHTRASGVQSRTSGVLRHPPSSINSTTAASPANAGNERDVRHPATDAGLTPNQEHVATRDVNSPPGVVRSSERLSRAVSRSQGSRAMAHSNEDSADRFLADLGGQLTHDAKQETPLLSEGSTRNHSPGSRHSQPTEATLMSLRELGYVVIPPGAPEHYERHQSMPLRRQHLERRGQQQSARNSHHTHTRSGNRDRGYRGGYYRDDRHYLPPPPRQHYPRYADEYDDRRPLARPSYAAYQPEPDMDEGGAYEVMYMRRQDIPQYYAPDHPDEYEDEREQSIRRASERRSRPPAEYEDEVEVSYDAARASDRGR